ALGRLRADILRPPRDLEHQLRLPLRRPPALRDRRPLDQRLLARAPVARRVVASQPPCVPPLRAARAALVGGRHLGARDCGARTPRPRLERGPHPARSPARAGGDCLSLLDTDGLRERVERLAAIERGSAGPGERRSAGLIAAELESLGCDVSIELE